MTTKKTIETLTVHGAKVLRAQAEMVLLLDKRRTLACNARRDGMTVADIATALNVSKAQAYVIIRRAP